MTDQEAHWHIKGRVNRSPDAIHKTSNSNRSRRIRIGRIPGHYTLRLMTIAGPL